MKEKAIYMLYSFPRAAVTKYHKLSSLKQQNCLSHSSQGQKSKIKVSAGQHFLSGL